MCMYKTDCPVAHINMNRGLTKNTPLARRQWTNQQVGSMWVTVNKPMSEHHFSKSLTELQKIKSTSFLSLSRINTLNFHEKLKQLMHFQPNDLNRGNMQSKAYKSTFAQFKIFKYSDKPLKV